MLADAPKPTPGKFDYNNFKPYKSVLAYSADDMIAHAKLVEPGFTINFTMEGQKTIIARNGEIFFASSDEPLPFLFKRATNPKTGEKVYLHTMPEPTDDIKQYLEPLATIARKLEFNVTFA